MRHLVFVSVLQYYIEVCTSEEEMNASTDSNVFVTLYGSNADSGRRHLLHSKSDTKRFQTGQVGRGFVVFILFNSIDRWVEVFNVDNVK